MELKKLREDLEKNAPPAEYPNREVGYGALVPLSTLRRGNCF